MEIHDMPPPSKTIFGVLKQVLCCLRIYPFPPYMKKKNKKLDYLHLKECLNYECEACLKQYHPNVKLLLLTIPQKFIDMLLKLVGDWLSQSL
jgi:hypothetical protein